MWLEYKTWLKAREEKLTSKYKQSRIQHQEQLKHKSAQLAKAFVDFQKKTAKMDLKDLEKNSEMAVLRYFRFNFRFNCLLRVTLQDQFTAYHDLELAFKIEEEDLLEKELAEMEEKNQKKSLFQSLDHISGSIESCDACKVTVH